MSGSDPSLFGAVLVMFLVVLGSVVLGLFVGAVIAEIRRRRQLRWLLKMWEEAGHGP